MGQSLFNVGRKLTSEEWGELKAWREANPELRWKRGDPRGDGMFFLSYVRSVKNGERWGDERALAKDRAYKNESARKKYHSDPSAAAAIRKAQYEKHGHKRREYAKAWYQENKEEYSEKFKARARKAYWDKTPEERAAFESSPGRRARKRNRSRERYVEDELYRLAARCRARVYAATRLSGFGKKTKTAAMLGCSWSELRAHIEAQFVDGMSWDRISEIHIDHIIPCASANTEEELFALFHYTNLQPLWAEDNLRKSAKMPHELLG